MTLGTSVPKVIPCRVVRLILVVLLLSTASVETQFKWGRAASPTVTVSVGDGVSDEDASYVREGIALARSYQYSALMSEIDQDIEVRILARSDLGEPAIVAYSAPGEIVVYAGSAGWVRSPPAVRIQIVVHEYIHVIERSWLPDTPTPIAMWLIEGMSEYFSDQAVAGINIVDDQDFRDYHRWDIAPDSGVPALEDLESRAEFYDNAAVSYSLGYLAVDFLLGGSSTISLDGLPARRRNGSELAFCIRGHV